jgi:hypothetical protein
MSRWEQMEEFLFSWELDGHDTFTNRTVARELDVTPRYATRLIAAYLAAMRNPTCNPLFAIRRVGRTSTAIWHIGHSAKDARAVSGQFADDVQNRVLAAITPDLDHIMALGPRARVAATKIVMNMGRLVQNLADLTK